IVLTAGGSQIKINGGGVVVTTGGKFECKAGQHLFVKGQNIIEPKINLPKMKTLFSNKINYQWTNQYAGEKEIIIIDKLEGNLIKYIEILYLSTHRFHGFRI